MRRDRPGETVSLIGVSAAILLLEIYWLRALSESEWGHLASMVVSTAMLGMGAGAAGVFVLGERLLAVPAATRRGFLAAFLGLAGISPIVVQTLPMEPLHLLWRPVAWGWLAIRELVVALPFAAGASAITLAFRLAGNRAARVYSANLLGSALGVLVSLGIMALRPAGDLLAVCLLAGTVSSAALAPSRPVAIVTGAAGVLWSLAAARWAEPPLRPEKDLAAAVRLPEARILEDRPGLRGRWTLVGSPALRYAPGLSLFGPEAAPEARAVFVQGDLAAAVLPADRVEILRQRAAWLPYALRRPRSVFVLGDAAPVEIQAAQLARSHRIVAVVPDGRTRRALSGDLGAFGGIEFERVELRGGGMRAALARIGSERFDLVVLPPDDSLASASAGLGATRETEILTVEGFLDALSALTPEGQFVVQRWTQAPPRDVPRMVATAAVALARLGIPDPRPHLALVQNWDASVLSATLTPWSEAERRALASFAESHGFDVLLPEPPQGPPVHALPGPPIEKVLEASLAGRSPEEVPFRLDPATDDRPYFHHFLSYRSIGAYFRLVREGSLPLSEWGDLFLWAGIGSALVLGAAGILGPALVVSPARTLLRGGLADTALAAVLGTGYMFLEVLFLHRGTRLFGVAAPSAAVTIAAFLLGSGAGAACLGRLGDPARAGAVAAAGGATAALALASGAASVADRLDRLPPLAAWAVFSTSAGLVALPLGLPFPAALLRSDPRRVPWLVAVNGWMSVVATVAASLVAVSAGFRALALAAAGCYALAATLLARKTRP